MNDFNKEEFAKVIMKIYLKYNNQREFAKKSNISRTYLSRYMNMKLDEPPKPKILQRLAKASKNEITYQQLMQICGYSKEIIEGNKNKLQQILDLANGLSIQEANYLIKVLNKSKIQTEKEIRKNE